MRSLVNRTVTLHEFSNRCVNYLTSLEWQRECQNRFISQRKRLQLEENKISQEYFPYGSIFLLEHEPVYTLGKGANEKNILNDKVQAIRVERGGEVTYHGPGQLVGYLVLDLHYFKKDLHVLVSNVEECIINTITHFGVKGTRVKGKTGVWVGESKIAAIGINTRHWVTMHGFAINVNSNCLDGFSNIIPCGISTATVTSLSKELSIEDVPISKVRDQVKKQFSSIFEVDYNTTFWDKDFVLNSLSDSK